MLKLSDAEKAEFQRRSAKSAQERAQTKTDLIHAARAAEVGPNHPEYMWPDLNDDAWFHRKSEVNDLIQERGGFSHHVAILALTDSDWETKETVAAWLRSQLMELRKSEAKSGTSPVRREKRLSRTEIADAAVEMLQCIAGDKLICLFQELLDVDRHRRSHGIVFAQMERAAEIDAQCRLQGRPLGVREHALVMSVSGSTVTRWRRTAAYRKRVEMFTHVWGHTLRDDYFESIRSKNPNATEDECFRIAFQMYGRSLPERRARRTGQGQSSPTSPGARSHCSARPNPSC